MEIILHIGTDKTGSTAIQHALSQNRNWFLSHSVYIPKSGFGHRSGHSQVLSTLRPAELKVLSNELQEASTQGYRVALISWEGMIRFSTSEIRRLANALPPFPIRILVYLREQAEVIQSGHLQWVKMNEQARKVTSIAQPRTISETLTAFLFIRNPRRNYYRRLRMWERCIPRAKFSTRVFSKSTLRSGDVITDFLDVFNLSKDAGFQDYTQNVNPSIDVEGALMIEVWRKSEKSSEEIDTLIHLMQVAIDRKGMSTKYFLDQNTVESIRRHFRRSNEKLAQRYMGSELYPFPSPSRCWRDPEEDAAAIEKRAAQLLSRIAEIRQTVFIAAGADIPNLIELTEGWCKPEKWGVWSSGKVSIARFRVPRHLLDDEVDTLRLIVAGQYYGENYSTSIKINDLEFGEQTLSDYCNGLVIPINAMFANEMIEVVFSHHQPTSPFELECIEDNRPLSFALNRIGCTLFQSSKLD